MTSKLLENRITVKVKGPENSDFMDLEIFFSSGLVRRLASITQNLSDLSELYSNPMVQELLLLEMVVPRNERGKLDNGSVTLQDYDMSQEDGEKLLDLAIEHILSFFTNAASKLKAAAMNENGPLKTLTESLSGLASLQNQKQLAGHTETS